MGLSQNVLFANASADIVASETGKVRAMAGILLITLNNNLWVAPKDKRDAKNLAATLSRIATLSMPKTTWEAYAKGCDIIAAKMGDNLAGTAVIIGVDESGEDIEVDFDALRDGSEVDAVSGMVKILTAYGATSGGQIRDWAKQEGFTPYDAERVKRERKAKQDADKAAKHTAADALFLATVGRDSASLPDVDTKSDLVPVSGLAGILAGLAALTGAERLEAMAALNTLLEADAAAVATIEAVKETAPPMLPDHVEDEVTTPNKARRARAVKAAKAVAEAEAQRDAA